MIREFFYLQKSDRKVILTFLVVIVSALTITYLTGGQETTTTQQTQKIKTQRHTSTRNEYYASTKNKQPERFAFDPNTADSSQLLRLGLQPWQVRNIYKYRAAGGIYRQPLDFAKLYGLTVKQYRELEPYIRISSDYLPASTLVNHEMAQSKDKYTSKDSATNHYPHKIKPNERIVLNTADTTTLMTIPGIGPYYARRIVQYGNRLGGFVSVDQLDEIDNLPTEAKTYLVIENPSPRRLNVNQLSLNELRRHPYINFYMAKAITDYRRLHGPLKSLNELRLLKDFSPEVIKRLAPYVAY